MTEPFDLQEPSNGVALDKITGLLRRVGEGFKIALKLSAHSGTAREQNIHDLAG
jgi:hypothetical protein